ncbi:sugar kinase [Marilutibacter alkalisoli]|uniref:Sugar kinase n=1 Tax=Marilutibacter alkalisoli TaxID=2591633 RepID=A0A514BNE8_9GAMM|nr:sugar kinase [Lysobacter alkalisoli]QDH68902.1 sugar kinase [Lysobacter alkalisoli]
MSQSTIICYGELLLRLSAPGRGLLLQTPSLDVHVGGAEANVAVSLARFGHRVGAVGTVADNALGESAIGELRRHGVDTRFMRSRPGRMGLYFIQAGALQRPSRVLYDRADSAFTRHTDYDWKTCLEGAGWLHLSGVTPALGLACADSAIAAAEAARAAGAEVSFDGNFRSLLWRAWDADPPAILRRLMGTASVLFADHRDMAVVLGAECDADSIEDKVVQAATQAFKAFPHVRYMACTQRRQVDVDYHVLSAMLVERDGSVHTTPSCTLAHVVDRIGGGDAFAAGVLHGLVTGMAAGDALRFGFGAACLKHSVPGDFNLVGVEDVEAFLSEDGFHVRR